MAAVAARVRRVAQQCPVLGAHPNATARVAALRGSPQYGVFDRVAGAVPRSSLGRVGVCTARRRQTVGWLVQVRDAPGPGRAAARVDRVAARQEGLSDASWAVAAGCARIRGPGAAARPHTAQPRAT